MTAISNLVLVAFVVEVIVLLLCAIALLSSMIAYRRHVLYRSGVGWLVVSLVLVTVGAIVELWGFLAVSDPLAVAAMAFYTGASAAILASMWSFARGFIHIDQSEDLDVPDATDSLTVDTPDGDRGFEDAGE